MEPIVGAVLAPVGVIAWLIVGLAAGLLAGGVMSGKAFGLVGDIVIGLVTAFVFGFIVSLFAKGSWREVGSILVAFVGACLVIGAVHLFRGESVRI